MVIKKETAIGSAVFLFSLGVLQLFSALLELNREGVLSGQIWRIWSGHFVHTNIQHLLLNGMAAVCIYFLFFTSIKIREIIIVSLLGSALISFALLIAYPQIDWYNGLSGLLHALVTYYSIRLAWNGNRVFWVGVGVVWLKVLVEFISVDLGYQSWVGQMLIITEAHLVAAWVGTVMAVVNLVWMRVNFTDTV